MPFCDTCDRHFLYGHEHKCPPIYTVACAEYDTSRKVYANDHEEAAERWASLFDWDGDFIIVGGHEVTVVVTDDSDEEKKFRVSGRSEPVYDAEEITQEGECP